MDSAHASSDGDTMDGLASTREAPAIEICLIKAPPPVRNLFSEGTPSGFFIYQCF